VRTSLGDHLVALRRPAALAAVAAAFGGVVAVMAPRLGLWRLSAQVQALDTIGEQAVTTLRGAESSRVSWAIAAVGVVIVVNALLVALDRPPPRAEGVLLAAGVAVLLGSGLLLVTPPGAAAFADHAAAAELLAGDAPLPTGVDIDLSVRPASGLWMLPAGGVLVLAGTVVALRRG